MNSSVNKMLSFGLLGALGCFAAACLGEGLLFGARLATPSGRAATPTLVSRPPPPSAASVAAATRPAAPAVPKAAAAPPPPAGFEARRAREKGGTGDVHIQLKWDNFNDLDIHCIDPDGFHICFDKGKRRSRSGGELDVDMNHERHSDEPYENIFWKPGTAPLGRYVVFVHYYAWKKEKSFQPTDFEVTIRYGDKRENFKGRLTEGQKSIEKSFELRPSLQVAAAPSIELAPDGENRLPVVVAADYYRGPVVVSVEGDLGGVTAAPVTIREGETRAELLLRAAAAKGGSRALKVRARAGDKAEATADFTLLVRQPGLRLAVPDRLEVAHDGEVKLPISLVSELVRQPVTLEIAGDLSGLTASPVTLSAGESMADLPLRASLSGGATRTLRVVAKAEGVSPAEAEFSLVVLAPASPSWNWLKVPVMALWTGLLACGLSLALVIGQNRSLKRPWLTGRESAVLVVGGLLAGGIAGGLGEALQHPSVSGGSFLSAVGFLAGWLLLGGLVGRGVGFFIPNLDGTKAAMAGAAGGLLGGLVVLGTSALGLEAGGRLTGAVLLGFCIGLWMALIEAAFRSAWLEIEFRPREVGTANLGPDPVSVGGSRHFCKVLVPGAPDVALRYSFLGGKVLCEDVATGQRGEVPPGHRRTVAGATVTVRTASDDAATAQVFAAETILAPPPADRPPVAVAVKRDPPAAPYAPKPLTPAKPPSADGCPTCGRKAQGNAGSRYCMVCDQMF